MSKNESNNQDIEKEIHVDEVIEQNIEDKENNNDNEKKSNEDEKNNESNTMKNEDISEIDEVGIDNKKDLLINDLTNLVKRVQAEFDNYIKRNDNEKKNLIKFASKDIMLKLLPILDSFDLALKNTSNNEEFVNGINMIHMQLIDLLKNEGLKEIDTSKKFDPNYHEAILVQESDKDDNLIVEEVRKGYLLNDNVLRHSLVKVSKKKN
jgi:molecular chaperone GrpE